MLFEVLTIKKKSKGKIPFIPGVRITLLPEIKNGIWFSTALMISISIKTSQLILIPEMTSLSFGYPMAKSFKVSIKNKN